MRGRDSWPRPSKRRPPCFGPKGKGQKSMRDADVNAVKEYSAEDADVTWQLHRMFEPMLERDEVIGYRPKGL